MKVATELIWVKLVHIILSKNYWLDYLNYFYTLIILFWWFYRELSYIFFSNIWYLKHNKPLITIWDILLKLLYSYAPVASVEACEVYCFFQYFVIVHILKQSKYLSTYIVLKLHLSLENILHLFLYCDST